MGFLYIINLNIIHKNIKLWINNQKHKLINYFINCLRLNNLLQLFKF